MGRTLPSEPLRRVLSEPGAAAEYEIEAPGKNFL